MDFADIVFGLVGFTALFVIFAVVRAVVLAISTLAFSERQKAQTLIGSKRRYPYSFVGNVDC